MLPLFEIIEQLNEVLLCPYFKISNKKKTLDVTATLIIHSGWFYFVFMQLASQVLQTVKYLRLNLVQGLFSHISVFCESLTTKE